MWFKESIFYQIYPFGFCGAPKQNDDVTVNRIKKIEDWIPHFNKIGINALYLCPIFESDAHGYDTRDYSKIDCRLGAKEDFKKVVDELHKNNIKIVLDGVFNHVGRGFWAFQDVIKNRENSLYKDWFFIDFSSNSNYNDGLYYEGWEGHYDLVKLNLNNPDVIAHLFSCIDGWVNDFDIDGLRLDVAYLLSQDFLKQLNNHCKNLKSDFFLVGETIHGDYNQIVGDGLLDSCTNYECYKGLYSSFNEKNMYEIAYSLNRQFGKEDWTLYKGKSLFNFVDNHDVNRIASTLENKENLPLIYTLLFTMPGAPCLYYGSEWGIEGKRSEYSDHELRPNIETPIFNDLAAYIYKLSNIRKNQPALSYGDYRQLAITNTQFVFAREFNNEIIVVAINLDEQAVHLDLPLEGQLINLMDSTTIDCSKKLELPSQKAIIYKVK